MSTFQKFDPWAEIAAAPDEAAKAAKAAKAEEDRGIAPARAVLKSAKVAIVGTPSTGSSRGLADPPLKAASPKPAEKAGSGRPNPNFSGFTSFSSPEHPKPQSAAPEAEPSKGDGDRTHIVDPREDHSVEALTRAGFLAFDCGPLEVEAIEGVPREWCEGAARLASMTPPRAFDADRWTTIVADVRRFLREWGAEACRLGWPEWALFGVRRASPASWRGSELATLLNGRVVVELTARAATIRTRPGNHLVYYLPPRDPLHPAERCLLWELA